MTFQNTNQQANTSKPTHSLWMKADSSKKSSYESIGVAWEREDGGLYIKLHGVQLISKGFYAFPKVDSTEDQE
ncbi:hypothetical protein [Desulfogranum japonicum]|uniref:hypothetical protein n=1 Tax=Desulfogranum japonicum TaxID=231447 RepID=UPI00129477CC|nr:hypothetical protein [Desulfogranum japonicum]